MSGTEIGFVVSSAPDTIAVEISELNVFEDNKEFLQIGRYLKIAQGNKDFIIAVIKNLRGDKKTPSEGEIEWVFIVECQTIGTLIDDKSFERGTVGLPVPTELAYIADSTTMNKIFVSDSIQNFKLGTLSLNKTTKLSVDGDKFFSKHLAIVGSTGSGKSCTVSKIIQKVVGIDKNGYLYKGKQNNSHFIIFKASTAKERKARQVMAPFMANLTDLFIG
jgi:Cdc6-like AAA superfamily ATPase